MYQRSIIFGALVSLALQSANGQPAPPVPQAIQPAEGVDSAANLDNADYDVLMHGVVHEAFVTPAAEEIEAVVVAQRPPEPIVEEAPDAKPDGNNVLWIPGYWAWEIVQEAQDGQEEQHGFVWVSGLWRDVPPDRTWLPGEWVEVSGGFQWSPGYWQLIVAEAAPVQQQTVYLPSPPASIDQGPNVPSPGADCFWIPGQWRFRRSSYVWTPGFWARQQSGWVWTPARYLCTPRGHIYVPGFWDYEPVTRGQLFGVVVFRRPVYRSVSFRYCPSYAISSQHLMTHLFVGSHGRFYYGNHYTSFYSSRGYRPWYECSHWRHASPIISYYRWQDVRRGRDFDAHMKQMRLSVQVSFGNSRTFADAARHAKRHGGHHHHAHPVTTVADVRKIQEERRHGKGKDSRPGDHDHHHDGDRGALAGAKSPLNTRPGQDRTKDVVKATRPGANANSRFNRDGSQFATSPTSKGGAKTNSAKGANGASQASSRPSRLDRLRSTSPALAGPGVAPTTSTPKPQARPGTKPSSSTGTKAVKPSRTATPAMSLDQLRSRASSAKSTVVKPTTTARPTISRPTVTKSPSVRPTTRSVPNLTSPATSKPRPATSAPKIQRPTVTKSPSVRPTTTRSVPKLTSPAISKPRPATSAPKIQRPAVSSPSSRSRSTGLNRTLTPSTPSRSRATPTPSRTRPAASKPSRPSRPTRSTMSRSNRRNKDKS